MAGDVQESDRRIANRDRRDSSGDQAAEAVPDSTPDISRLQKPESPAVPGPRPEEVARAATMILGGVAGWVANWPAGVISFVGSALAAFAVGAEVMRFDPLNTTEFVTTVVVGAILALGGPLVIGVDRAGVRSLARQVTDATRSQAEQASQDAEARASRTLQDGV